MAIDTQEAGHSSNKLEITASRQFNSWLAEVGASVAFTTYQAGKLFMLGLQENGTLSVFERTLDRCMGMVASGNELYVSTLFQIWKFSNIMGQGERQGQYDSCYLPQMSWVTGDIDVHDMALLPSGDLVFANTLFSCLARPSGHSSFTPVWHPPFVSKLAAEDRCHLNGLAVDQSGPAYVTCVSQSDIVDGWRDHRQEGGCVIDVRTDEVIASGLSMPHSPRLHDGKLWILESGTGYLGVIDIASGRFEPVTFCSGYARGMTFVDQYAIVGLSLPRNNNAFQGLALDEELRKRNAKPRCGLLVVDTKTGDVVQWIRIEGIVSELYDVAVLPGTKCPSLVGFKSDEIRRVLKVGN
ncbi:MAG: TIGR03032 family protein [Kordiimonadaceae bacterium]|nr:TIGR03032 family protein [Kordiimonadaceae bacterium]MBO6570488.1 TIGR03032 family protein [Kordiimonadaceae bacterium]MBO6966393.1 TIGR03032 family protein [Kordiimonadaceae bacterium]